MKKILSCYIVTLLVYGLVTTWHPADFNSSLATDHAFQVLHIPQIVALPFFLIVIFMLARKKEIVLALLLGVSTFVYVISNIWEYNSINGDYGFSYQLQISSLSQWAPIPLFILVLILMIIKLKRSN